jgi:hypothetical protein
MVISCSSREHGIAQDGAASDRGVPVQQIRLAASPPNLGCACLASAGKINSGVQLDLQQCVGGLDGMLGLNFCTTAEVTTTKLSIANTFKKKVNY